LSAVDPAVFGSAPAPSAGAGTSRLRIPANKVQRWTLWALTASSFLAFIEPSPYEIMFVVSALVMLATGLKVVREISLILALLLAYNIGGLISLVPYFDEYKPVMFVAISFYLSITAIFFVMIMMEDTVGRLEALERGYVIAAVLATVAAIIGFFDIAGLGPLFTRYEGSRATGTFKDPNVLGPFLVMPAIFLLHRLLIGNARRPVLNLLTLSFIIVGLLLSFSRGAWADFAGSAILLIGLNFLIARRHTLRVRIVTITALGIGAVIGVLAIALTFDKVASMLTTRASLVQSYDSGETGRFGLQKRSIPLLLESPNGFGPLQFSRVMGADPHNVYVNGFASYGWLGGLAYVALIVSTVVVGWRLVFMRTPWQAVTLPVWASFFPQIVQGVQIDTDHWRHWWLMFGLTWGLAAVSGRWLRQQAAARQSQAALDSASASARP
jgi:hypothetical protein